MESHHTAPSPDLKTGAGPKPNPPRNLRVVLLTIFIDLVGFSIIFPLTPAMLRWYLPREAEDSILGRLVAFLDGLPALASQGSGWQTMVLFGGLLGALYSTLQFLFAPVWGRLSDRYGRRPILLWTLAGTALSYLAWCFSGSFWMLILARLSGGVMAGNLSVATAAVADSTSPAERGKGMALVGAAFGLGFMVGPALGGAAALLDLSAVFPGMVRFGLNPFSLPALAAFLLAAANLLWVWKRFPETLPQPLRQSRPERAWIPLPRLLRRSPLGRVTLVYFLFLLSFSGMEFSLTFLAAERLEYGPSENVRLFVFVGVILLLTQGVVVRRWVSRVGERPMSLCGFVLGVGAMACLALAPTAAAFYAGLAAMGIAVGLISPTLTSLASLYSAPTEQGRDLGTFRSAGSLARALGPLAAGVAYWYLGSKMAYALGGVVLLVPLALAWRLPPPASPVDKTGASK